MLLKIYDIQLSFGGKQMGYPMWEEVLIHAVVVSENEDTAVNRATPHECADEDPIQREVICIGKASIPEGKVVLKVYQLLGFTGKE